MISPLLDLNVRKWFLFLRNSLLSPFWLLGQIFINNGYIEWQDATDIIKSWLNIIIFTAFYKMDCM